MTARSAILIFTRDAGKEALYKGLSSRLNPNRATQITSSLIANTIACAAESGLPYFIVSSGAQQGESFAERFHNAFCKVFASGYDAVIALGTDCPGLQTKDILLAARELGSGNGNAVLGPASDGGTWLTAITYSQFQSLDFQQLPWNSGKLCHSLELALDQIGFEIVLLNKKGDIDCIDDVFSEARKQGWLRDLITSLHMPGFVNESIFYTSALLAGPGRRGPPEHLLL